MPDTPFIGMIAYFATSYAPRGWATCDGQTMQINQNQALFALLGTTFGGNGTTTFNLPDLRGRAAMGTVANGPLGGKAGVETYSLQVTEMPAHSHTLLTSGTDATTATPAANLALGMASGQDGNGDTFPVSIYAPTLTSPGAAAQNAVSTTGSGTPHENRQPYGVLLACIALQGIYPSRP